MHRSGFIAIFASAAAAAACGGQGARARSTTTVTSAAVERDLSPPSTAAVVERLALAACLHEVRCGRPRGEDCMESARNKARAELASFRCEPAAARARVEECLASIPAETCELDVTMRTNICPVNEACDNVRADLVSPGAKLAEEWRR